MELNKKYCCNQFEVSVLNINQKGFSIVVENNNANLVFNAVDTNKEEIL